MTDADQIVRVWDLPTRVFHWLVVTLVVVAYVTSKLNWMDWHAYAGYALLALVVFRLLCAARGRLPSLAAAPVSV